MIASSFIKMRDTKDCKKVNLYVYQRLIGKLMYFSYTTRPDIVFVVEQLNRYNFNPRKDYFQAVKRVVKYLKETIKISFFFGLKINSMIAK